MCYDNLLFMCVWYQPFSEDQVCMLKILTENIWPCTTPAITTTTTAPEMVHMIDRLIKGTRRIFVLQLIPITGMLEST